VLVSVELTSKPTQFRGKRQSEKLLIDTRSDELLFATQRTPSTNRGYGRQLVELDLQ